MYMWNQIQEGSDRSGIQQEEDSFYQQIGLKIKEETSEVLHLERSCVLCWKLDTLEIRLEILGKCWNVVLEKDGEDQLGGTCNKLNIP